MAARATVEDIICRYIRDVSEFSTADIERFLPEYGFTRFGARHMPSTYTRGLRHIVHNQSMRRYGLDLKEVKKSNTKVKVWQVISLLR